MNYFELFEIPVAPHVNRSQLSSKYFGLQKKYHPDFYSNASDTDKEEVLKISADINKAFNTFKDPDQTIEYFLRLNNALETDEKYELPPDFLMEMMDLNEAISEEGKERVAEQVQEFEKQLHESIEPVLGRESGPYSEEDLKKLKDYYFRKKYLKRILDRFDD
jgi:molecular chaperone HscB